MHVSVPGVFAHLDSWRPYLRVQSSMRRKLRIFRCSSVEVGFGLYINSVSRQSHTRHFTWIDVRDGKQTRQSEGASRMDGRHMDNLTSMRGIVEREETCTPFSIAMPLQALLAFVDEVVGSSLRV